MYKYDFHLIEPRKSEFYPWFEISNEMSLRNALSRYQKRHIHTRFVCERHPDGLLVTRIV